MLRRHIATPVADARRLRAVQLFAIGPALLCAVLICAGPVSGQEHVQPPSASSSAEAAGQETMPDIGLDWPDLSQDETESAPLPVAAPETIEEVPAQPAAAPEVTPEEEVLASPESGTEESGVLGTIDPAAPLRYSIEIEGLGKTADSLMMSRFNALSVLRAGERGEANVAQIRRRGRADATLLDELLRAHGYYDSRTRLDYRPGKKAGQIDVVLIANPGEVFSLDSVDVDGLSPDDAREAALRGLFTVKPGDPADTDSIKAAADTLRSGLLEGGYPFAAVREAVLVVNHEQHKAELSLGVLPDSFRRIDKIIVNRDAPFNARHVAVIARFAPGDPYKQADITDLNHAVVATGLVSQVTITPEPGATDDTVDLSVQMRKAPPRTIAGLVGYGTGEGASVQASWTHRNLFPPEGGLTVKGLLGTQQQSAGIIFRRPNFGGRDRVLTVALDAANVQEPAYHARSAGIGGSLERQTTLFFQKKWTWSLGGEFRVSDETDVYGTDQVARRRQYVIAAMPTSLAYDGSDDLLDPRRGFRLGARISPELSLQGGAFTYVRMQADGSGYFHINDRTTLAGRFRLGTIVGASSDRIAPTRRFYAGGGASVRGYGYQAIGPRDANNDPTGGRSLGEVSLEARFRFGAHDQYGLVPFIDAGTISTDPWPNTREVRVGAGLGLRYYSSFGPIRLDIGTPLNPQPGDARIGVYVSLGQAF